MSQPVVVGVDGSGVSGPAIALALEEARLRGTSVRVVHVWHVPEGLYAAGYPPTPEEVAAYEDEARRLLDDAVSRLPGPPQVHVAPVLVQEESAAQVLVAESESAVMLVVGSRGLHGLRELVLGSVSHACCRHAHCPVLVVPTTAHAAE